MILVSRKSRLWCQFSLNFILLAGLALVLARCGNNSTPASGTFTAVYTNTLSNECIQCHEPGSSAGFNAGTDLDFSTQAKAYSTLTSGATAKVSATDAGTCIGAVIVVASSPTTSYLPATIFSDYATQYTGPSGCTPYNHITHASLSLSSAEETSIITWITNGALNN